MILKKKSQTQSPSDFIHSSETSPDNTTLPKRQLKLRRSHVTLRKRSNPNLTNLTITNRSNITVAPANAQIAKVSNEQSTSLNDTSLSNGFSNLKEKDVSASFSSLPPHPYVVTLTSVSPQLLQDSNEIHKPELLNALQTTSSNKDPSDYIEFIDHMDPTLPSLPTPPFKQQRTALKSIMKPSSQHSIEHSINDTNGTIEVSSKKSVTFQENPPILERHSCEDSTCGKTITSTLLKKALPKSFSSVDTSDRKQLKLERNMKSKILLSSELQSVSRDCMNENMNFEDVSSLEKLYFEPDHYSPDQEENNLVDDLVDKYDHMNRREIKKLKKKVSKTAILVEPPHLGKALKNIDPENSDITDKCIVDSTKVKSDYRDINIAPQSSSFTTCSILNCEPSLFNDLSEYERINLQLKLLKQKKRELRKESRLQFWSNIFQGSQKLKGTGLQPLDEKSNSSSKYDSEFYDLELEHDGICNSTPVGSSTSSMLLEDQDKKGQHITDNESRFAEKELKRILKADAIDSYMKSEAPLQKRHSFSLRNQNKSKNTEYELQHEPTFETQKTPDLHMEIDEDNEKELKYKTNKGRTRVKTVTDNLKSLFYRNGGRSLTNMEIENGDEEHKGVLISEDGMILIIKDLLPDSDSPVFKSKKKLRSPTKHITHPDALGSGNRIRRITTGDAYSVI